MLIQDLYREMVESFLTARGNFLHLQGLTFQHLCWDGRSFSNCLAVNMSVPGCLLHLPI